MTFTFNPEIYSELLSKHQPRVIKSEEENEKFLAIFEDKHYQINASTPNSRLLHLIDARSLEPADLVGIIGSSEVTAEFVNGQQEISKEQAEALGKFFHVEPSLFLSK